MATPALPPGASGQNLDGPPPQSLLQPPGIDMTGICFRDQLWLNTYPLDRNLIFDYFALSPFYDWQCINEDLRRRGIHPLDISHLSKMTGLEYMLTEAAEPNLFVIRKRWRDGPEKVTDLLAFYVLDGSIYQSPQLTSIFAARVGRALYHVSKAFTTAASKLEKIGYAEPENESETEAKAVKETVDFKEVKRVDHILASLQRKLPPAPPPPPFPDGFIPPQTSEAEKETENQSAGETQAPHVDPIIDQGPAKRMKF